MKSAEKIKFTELAQKFNLKNRKGKRTVQALISQHWGTGNHLKLT